MVGDPLHRNEFSTLEFFLILFKKRPKFESTLQIPWWINFEQNAEPRKKNWKRRKSWRYATSGEKILVL